MITFADLPCGHRGRIMASRERCFCRHPDRADSGPVASFATCRSCEHRNSSAAPETPAVPRRFDRCRYLGQIEANIPCACPAIRMIPVHACPVEGNCVVSLDLYHRLPADYQNAVCETCSAYSDA